MMNKAIFYALCALGFSAISDFVFKVFALKNGGGAARRRSCGMFVSVAGIVFLLFLLLFQPWTMDCVNWSSTLLWASVAGFFSVVSNILVIEAMNYQSAGITSTIFRLNMVLVVLGAWLFLGEPLTCRLLCGILCALAAIIAFLPRDRVGQQNNALAQRGFALAVAACVLRAGMSLTYKYGLSHGTDVNILTIVNALFWVFGGVIYALLRERRVTLPCKQDLLIGAVSGFFISGILYFMARMNACGNASVVNPIAQMSFLMTFVLSVLFLKEKLDARKIIAVILGCIAVLFLTLH